MEHSSVRTRAALPLPNYDTVWRRRGLLHLFEKFGTFLGIDQGSGTVSQFDELTFALATTIARSVTPRQAVQQLAAKYNEQALAAAIAELTERYVAGDIFGEDDHLASAAVSPADAVSSLCLMLAEDCNLRCVYCYAKGGSYGGSRRLMPGNVAQAAVKFLVNHAGEANAISLSLFGGEPLLNFGVLKSTVLTAERKAKDAKLAANFSLTTNATLLSESVRDFLADHPSVSVILSLDGGAAIQNLQRPFRNGRGSHQAADRNVAALMADSRIDKQRICLRGTFLLGKPHIRQAVSELRLLGLPDISVEPAFLKNDNQCVSPTCMEAVKEAYDELSLYYRAECEAGRPISFYHFALPMARMRRFTPLLSPCSAGVGYLAVAADGQLYPCHRFVGDARFTMGDVWHGITHHDLRNTFGELSVHRKEGCETCWAKYYCGGGCHCQAMEFNDSLTLPYQMECELLKHRLELSAYLCSALGESGAHAGFGPLCNLSIRPEFADGPDDRIDEPSGQNGDEVV